MCVIIYIPKTATIEEQEIREAWSTNPHGAGYSIQKDGKVHYKRGFMNLENYIKEIKPLVGKYNLLLHFRISTSKSVNRVQTHPYKKGDVMRTQGVTDRPVICMNGIISKQKEYKDCNDTMSYIVDHQSAFANINQDILNIIEDATGAKWAVMKPDEVLLSSKFTEEEGRFYSNKNHLIKSYYYSYYYPSTKKGKKQKEISLKDLIGNKLLKGVMKDKEMYYDLLDFVDFWCNQDCCQFCTKCLKNANTLRDIKITLNENYYYSEEEEYNDSTYYLDGLYEEDYDNSCCLDYIFKEDNYSYNEDATYYVDGKILTEEEYFDYIDNIMWK